MGRYENGDRTMDGEWSFLRLAAAAENTLVTFDRLRRQGPIDTLIFDGQADSVEAANEIKAQFIAAVPLNRLDRAEEIAAAAVFLGVR